MTTPAGARQHGTDHESGDMKHIAGTPDLPPVNGYSHAVRASGDLVVISGQIALDAAGEIVGAADVEAQTRQVFLNVNNALRAAGATFADVVKLTFYLTDVDALPAVRRVRDEWVDTARPPASTAFQVAALIRPELLIEVDALAVVGGGGGGTGGATG
jgi:reactive intermediate/imine deaminase